jgi:hypothetical protein
MYFAAVNPAGINARLYAGRLKISSLEIDA